MTSLPNSLSVAQKNTRMTLLILRELHRQGVQEVCLCPSKGNAPLVTGLHVNSDGLRVYHFFEERSAAFFALGRAKATGRPVAVAATAGTAVGELLPAVMEAYYTAAPLVLLSADRPRRYRDSGAPQVAEQVGIFGIYADPTIDLEYDLDWTFPHWDRQRPIHLNICFDEPFFELGLEQSYRLNEIHRTVDALPLFTPRSEFNDRDPDRLAKLAEAQSFLYRVKRPLVLVGALAETERSAVAQLLLHWGFPTYFENLSGLREDLRFENNRIYTARRIYERALENDYPIDGVIRFGGIPTLRMWRDLDLQLADLPVLSISRTRFSGLARRSTLLLGELAFICGRLRQFESVHSGSVSEKFRAADEGAMNRLNQLLAAEPHSEPALTWALSKKIPARARIYLGNSMPIREWDLAATREDRQYEIWGSRGLNGIDGQISTFYGFAQPKISNWAIIGDLTAMYDLSGPWILPQLADLLTNLVIINNSGGKLFHQFFPYRKEFQNVHNRSFRSWAEMWDLNYSLWHEIPSKIAPQEGHRMMEIVPDEDATQRFWENYSK